MKKLFSILFVMIVLLSSVHFTVASHFCEGRLAAVKAGWEGTTASCGMEKDVQNCPHKLPGISPADCCTNSSHVLCVDNYTVSSPLEIQKIKVTLLQDFLAPVLHTLHVLPFNNASFADEGFHHPLWYSPGRLAFICVFRK